MRVGVSVTFVGMILASLPALSFGQNIPMDNGNYWQVKCNSADIGDRLQCASFVTGTIGGFIAHATASKTLNLICIPSGVTFGQTGDIFGKYLNEHPVTRNQNAATMAILSLWEAFPCP